MTSRKPSFLRHDRYMVGDIVYIDADNKYMGRNFGYIRERLKPNVPYEVVATESATDGYDYGGGYGHPQIISIKDPETGKIEDFSGCYFIPLRPNNITTDFLDAISN